MDSVVMVTIRVCDEARKVNQNFSCSRDLLLAEMNYFEDYLPSDSRQWEDIDIAVHCDVQIFDWLMCYVHGNATDAKEKREPAQLDPSNAISILISSDFLKMPNLVDECVRYCHDHLSDILSMPCNTACISDQLVKRIAALFDIDELEAVSDNKDKIKSKLFAYKLQELFSPQYTSASSPSNASQLFRCYFCSQLLIPKFQARVRCTRIRSSVDRHGSLVFNHARDTTWSASEFVMKLKNDLISWRKVFWSVWSHVNHLVCSSCGDVFPCVNFGQCPYHPQSPRYGRHGERQISNARGIYDCCQQSAIRFKPLGNSKGCCLRDHKVNPTKVTGSVADDLSNALVYNCLQRVKDCIAAGNKDYKRYASDLPVLDSFAIGERKASSRVVSNDSLTSATDNIVPSSRATDALRSAWHNGDKLHMRLEHGDHTRVFNDEPGDDEDLSEYDEPCVVRVVISPHSGRRSRELAASNASDSSWNVSLPTRLNQDVQRENDLKRMTEMSTILLRCPRRTARLTEASVQNEKEFPGGLYHRLEYHMKSIMSDTPRLPSTTASRSVSRWSAPSRD